MGVCFATERATEKLVSSYVLPFTTAAVFTNNVQKARGWNDYIRLPIAVGFLEASALSQGFVPVATRDATREAGPRINLTRARRPARRSLDLPTGGLRAAR